MTADRARGAVLITGASTGIGAGCALHLDRVGLRVWAGVRRSSDGETLVARASRRLTPIILDVTDSNSIAAALDGALIEPGAVATTGCATASSRAPSACPCPARSAERGNARSRARDRACASAG